MGKHKPRVIGFGEAHQVKATAHVRSSLSRFTGEVLPVLGTAKAANLVLETWAERESCGKAQKAVDTQVRKDTKRPKETQSELVDLLNALKERGMGRHGMAMTCVEYKALLGEDGKVDYARLLSLITDKLGTLTTGVLGKTTDDSMVVIYGGALHNDLYPTKGVEQWSYAKRLSEASANGYIEIDLYVPEFIADDETLQTETWFELTKSSQLDKSVLVIERGPRSYVILAKRGVANPRLAKPAKTP